MQIQIRTDNHIEAHEKLRNHIEAQLMDGLRRFSGRLTHVEVHLSDTNAGKAGSDDKRCIIEARLENRPPNAVSHDAETIDRAVHGAIDKLQRSLTTIIEKHRNH